MANEPTSKISEFYRGKSVLITGATGFMGKVLVEKLLRSCDLDTIYLLVRPKNGLTVDKRADQLFSSQVFDKIKEETSNYKDKVKIICGDIIQPNLGISDNDISSINKSVSVVFHLAERVQSNQNMKIIMEENVFSLRKLLELCRLLPKLQAIVHTSTAYCSNDESVVEERIYQSKVTVEFATSCLDNSDEGKLEYLKNHLMDHPDNYVFSKGIAENLLLQERGNLPLAIMRPSILVSSLKEPFPGWIDNFSIPGKLAAGVMKGILRTQVAYQENVIDIIPVDLAVNMTLAIAWYTAIKSDNRLLIYNCTSGDENPITWGEVCNCFQGLLYEYPSENIFRYPSFTSRRNPTINKLATCLDHYLPALFADCFYLLIGNKPKMFNCYKKFNNIVKSWEYYTTNQWKFISKNKCLILNEMTELDKELFNFDVKVIQWKSFILEYVLGIRQYLMKESPSTIQKARKNLMRHLWMYRAVNASFLIGMGYVLSTLAL